MNIIPVDDPAEREFLAATAKKVREESERSQHEQIIQNSAFNESQDQINS